MIAASPRVVCHLRRRRRSVVCALALACAVAHPWLSLPEAAPPAPRGTPRKFFDSLLGRQSEPEPAFIPAPTPPGPEELKILEQRAAAARPAGPPVASPLVAKPTPPPAAAKPGTSPPRPGATYPSSSAKPKDWAALEKAVAAEEAASPPEGEAALTHLFRTLYADADDDTRRAMVKSYQESGGTVLSTNWAEVGKEAVKMTAPEGMDVRKYEY